MVSSAYIRASDQNSYPGIASQILWIMKHLRELSCCWYVNKQDWTLWIIKVIFTDFIHKKLNSAGVISFAKIFLKRSALYPETNGDILSVNLILQYSFARLSLVFILLDKQLQFTSPCTWTADCICMKLIIHTTTACKSPFGKWCPSGRDSFLCLNFWQHLYSS